MASTELMKRWLVTKALLRHALNAIPACEEPQREVTELQSRFIESLEHNELELALDSLEELGDLVPCRGGFWRNLERAAVMMELHKRAERLRLRFLSTRPSGRQ